MQRPEELCSSIYCHSYSRTLIVPAAQPYMLSCNRKCSPAFVYCAHVQDRKVIMSVLQEPQSASASAPVAAQVSVVAGESKEVLMKQTEAAPDTSSPAASHNLQTHYDELLRVIAEIGKDVKPAYTNSKVSADRLKRNIALARTTLRDCLLDIERLSQIHSQK